MKIYVAGHRGMVGSAIVRTLQAVIASEARQSIPPATIITRTHAELDLTNQSAVQEFFKQEQPTQVYLAAAKVGGIHANNTYPADFIYQNLMMQAKLIEAAFQNGIKRLLFLGSSCIYPRLAQQPMTEAALLTGPLEPTNEPYAIAKIAGIKLCESYNRQYGASHGVDYRSVMPTNLYGPGDNYHPQNSHVIPALIRRFHEAKVAGAASVAIWGSGAPKREFLYVDDMAAASVFVMNLSKTVYDQHTSPMLSHINVGFGVDITIAELAQAVSDTVGYQGQITFDPTQPDGAPRKLMDSSRHGALPRQCIPHPNGAPRCRLVRPRRLGRRLERAPKRRPRQRPCGRRADHRQPQLVHASCRLVTLVGVIVIETADAVLVADKTRSQDVKHIVALLQSTKREEHTLHRKVNRPWGWYDSVDEGSRFKVKRILVNPKASLSLQKHHHRDEHWVVVSGTAEITNGERVLLLTENQSTYIPLGEVHRLANPGSTPLEIIEVQSGSYLGEDEILPYEDQYGREK